MGRKRTSTALVTLVTAWTVGCQNGDIGCPGGAVLIQGLCTCPVGTHRENEMCLENDAGSSIGTDASGAPFVSDGGIDASQAPRHDDAAVDGVVPDAAEHEEAGHDASLDGAQGSGDATVVDAASSTADAGDAGPPLSCTPPGGACTVGVGACAATGTNVCSSDQKSVVCSATPLAPSSDFGLATAGGGDLNCDGVVEFEPRVRVSATSLSNYPICDASVHQTFADASLIAAYIASLTHAQCNNCVFDFDSTRRCSTSSTDSQSVIILDWSDAAGQCAFLEQTGFQFCR